MASLSDFKIDLGECRTKSDLNERFTCEEEVGKDFVRELDSRGKLGRGLLRSGPGAMKPANANALIHTMEKTGQDIDDINMVKPVGEGVLEVRSRTDSADLFIKNDTPENILWTKQARNITDIVEDDSTTVLHQDLNRGIAVLSDEGKSPVHEDSIQGMEAGFAAVSEAIIMDNDRKGNNLATDEQVLSEIDFDTSLREKIPTDELDQLVWQMNDEVADKIATVLQCGGWDEAVNARTADDCFEARVSEDFREGIKGGVDRFRQFQEKSSVDFEEVAPLATPDAEDRVETMETFAEGSGDMEFSQDSLDAR